MPHISASLLAADPARLGAELRRAEAAGVDSFHFDLMDGHYVPNLALAPSQLEALRLRSNLPFYVHLELSNPDEVLDDFGPFHADLITVQWDTLTRPIGTFARIRARGAQVGLGLNPETPVEEAAALFPTLDLLLILGVRPGFGGQPMQAGTMEKVRAARRQADDRHPPLRIAVDGGVKLENVAALVQAGADCLIMGSALFQSRNMKHLMERVREAAGARSPR